MQLKNRNLFRSTRFILLKFPYLFQIFAKFRTPSNKILIIKTDEIGDYVLFRNFLKEVKTSTRYQTYEIDLMGNESWKDLALLYDKDCVSSFYFVNVLNLYHQPLTVLQLGWKLFKQNYEVVLQPSFTRTLINDGLAALTAAKQIIGFDGDFEAISAKIKKKTDAFYTKKLQLPAYAYFEFERNRFFFETFLHKKIELKNLQIPVQTCKQNYIAFCLGAGNSKRSCPINNFLQLAQLILQHTDNEIYLLGQKESFGYAVFIDKKLPDSRIKNLVGNTDLPEFINMIAKATLVICNESSAVHIAAACDKDAISILGGGHFGRFAPYPDHFPNQPLFIFEKMPCFNCNWICRFETAQEEAFPCISNVSLEQVWQSVQQLLNSKAL